MTDLRSPEMSTSRRDQAVDPDAPPVAPGVLVAQRGLFTGPVREVPEELYADILEGRAVRYRRELWVGPCSRVSTNTYFGRFPASYWWRWTEVRTVTLRGRVEGSARVLLRASDIDGEARTVAVSDPESECIALTATLDRFVDGGGLWFEVATDGAACTLRDVSWTVATTKPDRAAEVVICTHNRADDCLTTLRALGDEQDVLDVLTRVTVIDQGTDTLEARGALAEVDRHLHGRLRYRRQHNLGGSGGFARGMHDAVESGDPTTDVVLMDDDVRLEPEVVVRLTAFGRCATRPTIVGGQMLNLLHPTQVRAGAEFAALTELTAGCTVASAAAGDSDVTSPLPDGSKNLQDCRVEAGYTGWWACLIPAEVVANIGYPLPVFIKWDDVEYSMRAWRADTPVVTLPGAALWHADFDWKDGDDWTRYFDVRNALIVAALHSPFPVRRITAELGDRLSQNLAAMNYGLVATMVAAIEGFLAGPDEVDDGGTATVARIRELRSAHSETVLRDATEVPVGTSEGGMVHSGPAPRMPRVVAARRLVAHARGRLKFHDGQVRSIDSVWWHTSRFAHVAVTDAGQGGIRLRHHDPERFRTVGIDSARVLWRFYREAPAVVDQWRAAMPRLTSGHNWSRLFSATTEVERG